MKDQVSSAEKGPARGTGESGDGNCTLPEGFSVWAENLPEVLITTDSRGTVLFSNARAQKTFGYSRDEFSGIPVSLILPAGYHAVAADVPLSERPLELTAVRKDGTGFRAEIGISVWKAGENRHVILVVRDVTGRKSSEQTLQKSEEEIRRKDKGLKKVFGLAEFIKNEWERTVDCVGDMVILADNLGRVRRCNRTFKEFVNRTFREIIGRNWGVVLLERMSENGVFYRKGREIFHERSGRWFIVKSYPFIDGSSGKISGDALIVHDISDLKRAARELEAKNRELAEAYAELKSIQAKVLNQDKLESARKQAEVLTHEIDRPISLILNNLVTLEEYILRLLDFMGSQSSLLVNLDSDGVAARELDEKRRQLELDCLIPDMKELIRKSLEGAESTRTLVLNLRGLSHVDDVAGPPF